MRDFLEELKKEDNIQDFEKNIVRIIFWVSKEYGWKIEYVMKMGIIQFNEARDYLKFLHDEEERIYKESNKGKNGLTFG